MKKTLGMKYLHVRHAARLFKCVSKVGPLRIVVEGAVSCRRALCLTNDGTQSSCIAESVVSIAEQRIANTGFCTHRQDTVCLRLSQYPMRDCKYKQWTTCLCLGQNEHYDAKGTENPAAVPEPTMQCMPRCACHNHSSSGSFGMYVSSVKLRAYWSTRASLVGVGDFELISTGHVSRAQVATFLLHARDAGVKATARATVSSVTTPRVALPQAVSSQGRVKVGPQRVAST
eukprot:3762862-Amphidinium_carterae.1